MMNFLSVNRNLVSGAGQARAFRLPTMNPFPKLDRRIVRSAHNGGAPACESRLVAGRTAKVITESGSGLPEMVTDVVDVRAGYAVENVKRERSSSRLPSRVGFGLWIGRLWGRHRAAHP